MNSFLENEPNRYQDLEKTFVVYGQQYAWSVKKRIEGAGNIKPDDKIMPVILETTNHVNVMSNIFEALRRLLKENYRAYAVTLKGFGWYEGAYNDYFIDCNGSYYYLHFGHSE